MSYDKKDYDKVFSEHNKKDNIVKIIAPDKIKR